MTYDFDRVIDRRGTNSVAYEKLPLYFNATDVEPFWVADNGFATPQFIIDALNKRLEHPIFGYTAEAPQWRPALVNWLRDRQGWQIEPEWIAFIPGIVKGIGMAINALTSPGDKIIIQPPVYHPFRIVPESNGRQVVFNPLRELPDGSYEMDFDHLARVADESCKMLILCNPHNPIGLQWDAHTLARVAALARESGTVVVSDEIHGDLMLDGCRHIPFLSVSDDARAVGVMLGAPSKTFNIPGLVSSWMVVSNPALRAGFYEWME
ncbi:MAG: aminotransferase class I/II-fold pyridoxal phosphate-dependent enzyme, partial [Muribaculaceae bacterium]|nr:aminotransferase class I/II-fold pyridoxal phosphate-dependent enzyme [Muribaculaceae bacterium]